jgi:hypothetical protein
MIGGARVLISSAQVCTCQYIVAGGCQLQFDADIQPLIGTVLTACTNTANPNPNPDYNLNHRLCHVPTLKARRIYRI